MYILLAGYQTIFWAVWWLDVFGVALRPWLLLSSSLHKISSHARRLNFDTLDETVDRDQRRDYPVLKASLITERLKRLKLPSLELRRLYNDLIWFYKILFSYVDSVATNFSHKSRCVYQGLPLQIVQETDKLFLQWTCH